MPKIPSLVFTWIVTRCANKLQGCEEQPAAATVVKITDFGLAVDRLLCARMHQPAHRAELLLAAALPLVGRQAQRAEEELAKRVVAFARAVVAGTDPRPLLDVIYNIVVRGYFDGEFVGGADEDWPIFSIWKEHGVQPLSFLVRTSPPVSGVIDLAASLLDGLATTPDIVLTIGRANTIGPLVAQVRGAEDISKGCDNLLVSLYRQREFRAAIEADFGLPPLVADLAGASVLEQTKAARTVAECFRRRPAPTRAKERPILELAMATSLSPSLVNAACAGGDAVGACVSALVTIAQKGEGRFHRELVEAGAISLFVSALAAADEVVIGDALASLRVLACTHSDEVVSAGALTPLIGLHRASRRDALLALRNLSNAGNKDVVKRHETWAALETALSEWKQGMQIFLKVLTGSTLTFEVASDDHVATLKELVWARLGIQPDKYRLIFGGRTLEDGWSLENYNIQEGSTVHLILKHAFCAKSTRWDSS